MEVRSPTRAVCPEILSEIFGRPTGLQGNALVFWPDTIDPTMKASALNLFEAGEMGALSEYLPAILTLKQVARMARYSCVLLYYEF